MESDKKIIIDVMLAEYKELRNELRGNMQLQCTILSLFVTAIGIVFALLFKVDESIANDLIIQSTGLCLIPGISAFSGVLWLDQVFRQIRIGSYIHGIEKRVNGILEENSLIYRKNQYPALFWEHCVQAQNKNTSNLRIISNFKLNYINSNFLYYYVGIMVFILVPIISWMLVYQQYGLAISCWSVCGVIFFIFYILFAAFDVSEIIKSRDYEKIDENPESEKKFGDNA